MKQIPIVCFISTYREGKLAQGTIRSARTCTDEIVLFEGLQESEHVDGPETDLGPWHRYMVRNSTWNSESEKRTEMLLYAKSKIKRDFWCLLLDGDEILVWGEYLRDWLDVLEPGPDSPENVVPIKITEANLRWITIPLSEPDINNPPLPEIKITTGPLTFIGASHLYHSSLIDHYEVGAWRIVTPWGQIAQFDVRDSERPPMFGEPHIHHRSYLRRGNRAKFRAKDHEELRWADAHGLPRPDFKQ